MVTTFEFALFEQKLKFVLSTSLYPDDELWHVLLSKLPIVRKVGQFKFAVVFASAPAIRIICVLAFGRDCLCFDLNCLV